MNDQHGEYLFDCSHRIKKTLFQTYITMANIENGKCINYYAKAFNFSDGVARRKNVSAIIACNVEKYSDEAL